MSDIETNSKRITKRLVREGWRTIGGGSHDIYKHPDQPGIRIVVPRHKELSPGVARSIAKLAGWKSEVRDG
ncbi:MAG: type II toxin-antitoxin system HicA family toxin [Hyphomicrobiaceae bacterium]|nr:type II toxin-antitoxin system HicA family toxin [Hyphomicrobiaceae bacterium]